MRTRSSICTRSETPWILRISGKWEKADGRRRKVYSLTDRGREWLTIQSRRVRATFGTLDALLGGEE